MILGLCQCLFKTRLISFSVNKAKVGTNDSTDNRTVCGRLIIGRVNGQTGSNLTIQWSLKIINVINGCVRIIRVT